MSESSQDKTKGGGESATTPPATKDAKDAPKKKLTPEEQLAAYEEALKNEDWGHQPC